ncbi:7-carboxy-7-deazaguanine synthase QueE [uncultured Cyclobacterium sp.]|uniref:7-carboxy-7-deazaguanine synthase QueE n=1 Tax=uncultured Cyclobacterium sp. TaxID=453820 RepID=UPI0030EF9774|tara:strand:- start:24666 stop:25295 length:630 start_codon:yes stop_codon:yes gene_type:complete
MEENKKALLSGESLPLMEAFYTIQGEGMFSGQPAYFIRLGGCDVGCVWCDVKDSWEAERWPIVPIQQMVAEAESFPARLVVITGGEPLMHNLGPLTSLLKEKGFQINMETSGAHPFSGKIDWTCLSPKKFKQPVPEVYARADELKVVVFNKSDFDFALKHALLVNEKCHLLLQPEWSKAEIMTPLIIDFVKENPAWRVSLQTHKYMEIP